MSHSKELREQVEGYLTEGRWEQSHARLGDLWRKEGGLPPRTTSFPATRNYAGTYL